ncbi:hypothetical protein [Pendulispora albinea]|uniref:HEAT repeat domain-containing protein n=1 Tax=Pendulispora albinea TaxID=2741071 RepID=A0ABZ2LWD2_9BACT
MSFLDERQQKLVLDLLGRELSKDEFYRQFPVAPSEARALGLDVLRRALREHDADDVEFGLLIGFALGMTPDYVDTLHTLAAEDWHTRHEDVIDALDGLIPSGAPVSAEVLHHAALSAFPYRDDDEAFALGVKCIWALSHLRTPEAIERLGELLASENPILEGNAETRLYAIAEDDKETSTLKRRANELLAAHMVHSSRG